MARNVCELHSGRYPFEPRGFAEVKGKGLVEAWTLGGAIRISLRIRQWLGAFF